MAAPTLPELPGGVTHDQVDAAVDALYGRDIPRNALCATAPALPEALTGHPIPVGTRRGERGCVLVGVLVEGTLHEPLAALPHSLSPEAFAKLDAASRQAALLAWTDQVLLAFDRPDAKVPGTVTASKGNTAVTRRFLRRNERSLGLDDLTARWTYDAALMGTVTETVHTRWQTSFFSRPDHIEGLDQATVQAALTAKGKVIADCFEAVWAADPLAAGRVVFEWNVEAGKVEGLTVVTSPSETLNGLLARCYGNHIQGTSYPAEAKGRVRWSFAATRGEVQ